MPTSETNDTIYDCIIVGGGPAGLTCAIFLGRYRRRVLVVDSGQPRNYASHGIHGFLGQHGIKPGELLRKGRAEAADVGVEFMDTLATGIEQCGDHFEVTTLEGVVKSRRIVLAYGVRDLKPEIPDFERYYGSSIFHCPDCDGYEVCDKRVGIIGSGKRAAGMALKILQWTTELEIFTDGAETDIDPEEMSKLLAQGIGIRTGKIVALDGAADKLRSLTLASGEIADVDALFFSLGTERTTTLAEDLGCAVDPDLPFICVDEYGQTSVEWVYALGDLVPGSQLAITSAADGAIAAIAINKTLLPPGHRV